MTSDYIVGIDLGTTHCALSYTPCKDQQSQPEVQALAIAQLSAPGELKSFPLLPSFLYLPHDDEFKADEMAVPWQLSPPYIVGMLARDLGSKTPLRLVASAKSWLGQPQVDCQQPLLPLGVEESITKISPLTAIEQYLLHLRQAWDHQNPQHPLAHQQVVLTVPASFIPAARELTAQAAENAGLKQVTLLEEPQAAFYHWLYSQGEQWRQQVKPGDIILVVDIGGGTTDLSLIAVTEQQGDLALERVAIGDHILLGGDNMDLALAYLVKAKLAREGTQLASWQLLGLSQSCRLAKERLLADPQLESVPLVIASRGSRLIGGSIRTELTQQELQQSLLEGFFPQVEKTAKPQSETRTGLSQLGLNYAQDAAISRHLAAFLSRQLAATEGLTGFTPNPQATFLHPSALLFNGGVCKAGLLQQRIMSNLNQWLAEEGAPAARLLPALDLDLAVSQGACYYGYAVQHQGIRIRGGTAAAYYIGVASAMPAIPGMAPAINALCIAPFGMEEGTTAPLSGQEFGLRVGEPVRFRFFSSTSRREDKVGQLLDDWQTEQLEELDAIELDLAADDYPGGDLIPVQLTARLNELGTLCLEAVHFNKAQSTEQRWQLEWQVRGTDQQQAPTDESQSALAE
jgi:hypothetical protein